jgi:hypothetical protein
MISAVIRKMIEERFGHPVRYSKQCEALASHISEVCGTTLSASTLRRLLGFMKGGKQDPRLYTLDLIANYLGYKTWEKLLASFDKAVEVQAAPITKLKSDQVKKGESIQIGYEPSRTIVIRKTGAYFTVISSSDRKILADDEVKFTIAEIHYPLTFIEVLRKGNSTGRLQVAGVSGITSLKKIDKT